MKIAAEGRRRAIFAALAGNLLVALTKLAAAWWTGSSSMLTEGIHSLVDTGNEVLLFYGIARAARRPDPMHPFGFGRELYFWSFIVALLIFALGAGVSMYEGIVHILNPEPITDPRINYIVLALSALFEIGSWTVAFRQFRVVKGELGYLEAVRRSKDPPTFMVLFEDSAALVGLLIAFCGVAGSVALGDPRVDGLASILIGVVLAVVAVVLARESKELLIGERAEPRVVEAVLAIAAAHPAVRAANGALTSQLAPDQIFVALSLEFEDDLRVPVVEDAVATIEAKVRAAHPEVTALFIKPETPKAFAQAHDRLFGPEAASGRELQ
ncbi:cation diffusion facilitator family transporter [Nannocystis pusilla]|uniref:cation diffusion facilitator family transporter n=1 Tax=Nannocystis pusilla TaxID=889268 RepID=UPI003BF3AAB6